MQIENLPHRSYPGLPGVSQEDGMRAVSNLKSAICNLKCLFCYVNLQLSATEKTRHHGLGKVHPTQQGLETRVVLQGLEVGILTDPRHPALALLKTRFQPLECLILFPKRCKDLC